MQFRAYSIFFIVIIFGPQGNAQDYLRTASEFFIAVRGNDFGKADVQIKIIANASADSLKSQLDTHNKAKAFWLNLYNTYVQYRLKKDPRLFEDRSEFFQTEFITVASQKLSLDDIEHGIIRHSRNKYSLGYLGSFLVSDFEKKFRLDKIDYRIHFALNCGAKSCPPVALYAPADLELQLNKSTDLYLKSFSQYKAHENEVWVPALCSWFKADFGGESGVIEMMKKFKVVPYNKHPDVEYLPYDWTLKLSNYINL